MKKPKICVACEKVYVGKEHDYICQACIDQRMKAVENEFNWARKDKQK